MATMPMCDDVDMLEPAATTIASPTAAAVGHCDPSADAAAVVANLRHTVQEMVGMLQASQYRDKLEGWVREDSVWSTDMVPATPSHLAQLAKRCHTSAEYGQLQAARKQSREALYAMRKKESDRQRGEARTREQSSGAANRRAAAAPEGGTTGHGFAANFGGVRFSKTSEAVGGPRMFSDQFGKVFILCGLGGAPELNGTPAIYVGYDSDVEWRRQHPKEPHVGVLCADGHKIEVHAEQLLAMEQFAFPAAAEVRGALIPRSKAYAQWMAAESAKRSLRWRTTPPEVLVEERLELVEALRKHYIEYLWDFCPRKGGAESGLDAYERQYGANAGTALCNGTWSDDADSESDDEALTVRE